ncbi:MULTISPECIES: hypothetical protein [unclassified Nocardioides]|uniref:hypothetical protein n=1 Tax=unclassified Nocardioides TaxID=2615069 RepID=UPI001054D9D5|nr:MULTISPECIES: hypothetical protein [unclassified Nocardioides]
MTAHPTTMPMAGVRIAADEGLDAPLQVRAVSGPQPGDHTLERQGGRLYVGPDAAQRLEDGELDAETCAGHRVQFIVRAAS